MGPAFRPFVLSGCSAEHHGQCTSSGSNQRPWLPLLGVMGPATQTAGDGFSNLTAVGTSSGLILDSSHLFCAVPLL